VPILAGVVVLALGDRNALTRPAALVGAILGLLVTIPLYTGFDVSTSAMQFVELHRWIARFNINYHLGVDGISVLFVLLNRFITILCVMGSLTVGDKQLS